MSGKPTYEELERRVLELEGREHCRNKSEIEAFPQFEKHGAIILVIDPDSGIIINANVAAQNYYGYSIKTLNQMKIEDINMLPPDKVAEKRKQAAKEKLNYFEFPHRLSSGEIRTVEVHSSPVVLNGKKLLLSVIHDITDRKLAEESLRESEKRFRSIIENTHAGYFFIDRNGIIQKVNKAWIKMYRYQSAEEVVGNHFAIIQKTADLEKAKKFVNKIMSGDSRYMTGEFSRKCNDDTIGYHTFSARPVTKAKKVIGIEGFIIDTTDRKKAEEQRDKLIAELEEKLSQIQTLSGLLPICSYCKRIRDDKGYWEQIDGYIEDHSNVDFSHSICPECAKKYHPDIDLYDDGKNQE
jgi:PAS domain S-box-containing protein